MSDRMSNDHSTHASTASRPSPLLRRLRALVYLAAVGVIAATAVASLARISWVFDLAVHFRPQYAIVGAVCLLALLRMRRYALAVVVTVCVVVNAWFVVPYLIPSHAALPDGLWSSVDVLSVNVNTDNRSYADVCYLLRDEGPDIVVLLEVDDAWMNGLASLRLDYPFQLVEARSDNYGLAVLSRHPFEKAAIHDLARVPAGQVTIRTKDGPLHLIAAHTIPPVRPAAARRRNDQLRALASMVNDAGAPTLLVGDLNVTPWSPHFRTLLADAALVDSMRGRGIQTTWPRRLPGARIPIDHCLHTPDVTTVIRRIGPPIGSDHFPLIVTVMLDDE